MRLVAVLLAVLMCAGLGFNMARAADAAPTPGAVDAAPAPAPAHPLCWIEFSSHDTAASAAFFSTVFGWKTAPMEEMDGYLTFTPAKGLMGGLAPSADTDPAVATVYIYTPDLDAALAGVTAAGGVQTSPPEAIPGSGGGKIAMFMDPAGVIYGLSDMAMPDPYTPVPLGKAEGVDQQPVEGTIVHLELYGGDFRKTAIFFSRLFEWTTQTVGQNYMEYKPGVGVSGVFQNHTPEATALAYLWTNDINAKVAAIKAAGGKLLANVINAKEAGVSMAYFQTPGGIVLGLIGPLAQDAP